MHIHHGRLTSKNNNSLFSQKITREIFIIDKITLHHTESGKVYHSNNTRKATMNNMGKLGNHLTTVERNNAWTVCIIVGK